MTRKDLAQVVLDNIAGCGNTRRNLPFFAIGGNTDLPIRPAVHDKELRSPPAGSPPIFREAIRDLDFCSKKW